MAFTWSQWQIKLLDVVLVIAVPLYNHLPRHQLISFVLIDSCTKFGIPAMCFHIFPTCDAEELDSKPRLCREDCFALFDDICLFELQLAGMNPVFKQVLPNCSALPTRDDKDHAYCTSLGIPGQCGGSYSGVVKDSASCDFMRNLLGQL